MYLETRDMLPLHKNQLPSRAQQATMPEAIPPEGASWNQEAPKARQRSRPKRPSP